MGRDIFICIKDTQAKADKRTIIQPVLILKGDIVQFRYNSPKHFRTIYEEYFCVEDDVWESNFSCIGTVWEKIRWENTAKLEEILRLKLFDRTKEEEIILKSIVAIKGRRT